MVYNFFYQRTSGGAITNENITNKELAEESQKQIIEKLNERKAHSSFTDNIWGAFSADVELISKFNKGIRYLLCVFDIFSKYTWVIHLNDEKGITISNAFQKKLNLKASNRKPNKMWEHKESEFYDRSMRSFLQNNNIEIYSTHNEGKSAVVERFVRTLRNKIWKYMTSISKDVDIDKLQDIVNICNNIYHRTIKMKPVDVKSNTQVNYSTEINDKDPKFKIGDIVRISQYKNILNGIKGCVFFEEKLRKKLGNFWIGQNFSKYNNKQEVKCNAQSRPN